MITFSGHTQQSLQDPCGKLSALNDYFGPKFSVRTVRKWDHSCHQLNLTSWSWFEDVCEIDRICSFLYAYLLRGRFWARLLHLESRRRAHRFIPQFPDGVDDSNVICFIKIVAAAGCMCIQCNKIAESLEEIADQVYIHQRGEQQHVLTIRWQGISTLSPENGMGGLSLSSLHVAQQSFVGDCQPFQITP